MPYMSSNLIANLELQLEKQKENLKSYNQYLTIYSGSLSNSEVRHMTTKIVACKADIRKLEKLLS
jgi:hypothetical protein